MRKPKQPNTLGFYGYKKNAHSVTNRQVKHTASARNTKPLHACTHADNCLHEKRGSIRPNTINKPTTLETPRGIPAGFIQPPEEYTIIWDENNAPACYQRNYLSRENFDAEVLLDPQTGLERINVELRLENATSEQVRSAMDNLVSWFCAAVKARPLVAGVN